MKTDEKFDRTLTTLANAAELGAQVILRIRGERISDTYDGKTITLDAARKAVVSRIETNFHITSDDAAAAEKNAGITDSPAPGENAVTI